MQEIYGSHPMNKSISTDLRLQARVLSVMVVLLGFAVLGGWAFGFDMLKSLLPGLPCMKVNTSIGFILCGASLGLITVKDFSGSVRAAAFALTGIALLLAAITLAEYALKWNSGIDEFFFKDSSSGAANPGRTSIIAAGMFLLTGAALLLMALRRHYGLIQSLAFINEALAVLAFVGYLCGNLYLPLFTGASGMAAHTALGFLGLATGILVATARHGWIAALLPHARPISVAISVAILFVSIAAMLHSAYQSRKTVDSVAQTYQLLNLTEEIASASYEHKAINRSYLLTGNESLVARALRIRQTIRDKLDSLKRLTIGNTERQLDLKQLAGQFDDLYSLADRLILIRQSQGIEAAAGIVAEGEIDRLHAGVMTKLTEVKSAEQSFLQTQLNALELRDSIARIALSTVLLLGGGVLLLTFNILHNEITRRKQSERLEKSRSGVLELLACGASLSTVLEAIVLGVEAEHPAMRCSILLIDEAGRRLLHGAAPTLPDFYNQAVDGIVIGFGVGSCGTAAGTRQRVIVSDIQSHPFWSDFKALANKAGLASCWSEPVFSSEGKVLGTFAIYHSDIHYPTQNHLALIEQAAKLASIAIEKHQTDLALKASEARYRNLFEANPLPMWVFDVETLDFLAVDEAAIRHYGYSRDEFLAMKMTAISAPEECERLRIAISASEGANGFGIWPHITGDGREIQVEITAQLLIFEGRKAVIILANDVTDRLRIEQQLRKLSMAVDQSPESIVITDLNATIEYVNDAFIRNSGFSREETLGQNISLIKSGKTPSPVYRELWAALKQGRVWEGEFINRRKDGTEHNDFSLVLPIKDGCGMTTHYVAIQDDITEKKKLSIELEQHRHHLEELVLLRTAELEEAKAAAEAANVAKSAFLSNMSHEIRTPMNAVLGFCYLLEHQALPAESLNLVHKIHGAGKALLSIISDILDFSKIEAGRLDIENQPFQLNDMLENLAALMSVGAGSKNLELTILPPLNVNHLIGDEMRLQQVLVNLLSNAVKFTENGEVELRICVASEQDDQVYLRFSVRDTGIGISEDQQQAIFGAFSQADSSISRRFGGTGLGLAISQQLIAMMGGQLQIKSAPGVGSEFWFVLPFQRHTDAIQGNNEINLLSVLVIDDCETARNALQHVVAGFGWKADIAGSGEDAVFQTLAKEQVSYDVVLVDWKMPGLDGVATSRALRRAFAEVSTNSKKVPIILMVTAYSQEELKAQLDAWDVDGLLNKPVTPSSLYDAVNKAMRRDQSEAESHPARVKKPLNNRVTGVRILVVDDSDINREVARRILERDGALVSEARDGQEAVDWLSAHMGMVDVVLMDIQMPRLDGYSATRRIRENPGFANLPVLALTAGAFKNLQDAALNAGMNDFIAKPFNADLLIQKIRHWSHCEMPGNKPQDKSQETLYPANLPELPGIDVKRGLELWGDTEVYRDYISHFVSQYNRAGSEIVQLSQAGDLKAVAAFAHKLKGSSSSLALPTISLRSREIEKAVETPRLIIDAANALQQAIDEVADSVSHWMAISSGPAKPENNSLQGRNNEEAVKPVLNKLLVALDEDNPTNAKPLVSELEAMLGIEALADIKESVLSFDFRKAENLTRNFIDNLN
ncbi:response regulator [Methylomicrobium sp. RS1]|uniref:response regulator n=1 Tax=Candidatus Methylomicrobium oryzae TaxID=2802053 RepID=UPI0019235B90|nr:response regulator [Methylomicrobium sp. RS1]MBL1264652.1 response regulator [Methylomicrobium sp. RS1]